MADCTQLEKEVLACKEYYEELLKSAERGKLLDTSKRELCNQITFLRN